MAQSLKMPALGESVTEGTVTAWLKQVGDTIELDEPVVEVATDKVDSEVPSPAAGVLLEILVQEDETVEVGTELARIGSADEGPVAPSAPERAQAPQQAEAPQAAPVTQQAPATPVAAATAGEITEVAMPALGESVTEGTVTSWMVAVGDQVSQDDPIVEVATDKVDSEVPSPVDGYVVELLVSEDETVEVGTPMVRISSQAPSATSTPAAPAATPTPATPATPVAPPAAAPAPAPAPASGPMPPQMHTFAPPAPPSPPAPPAPPVAPSTPADPVAAKAQAVAAQAPEAGTTVPSAPGLPPAAGYVTPIVRKLAKDHGVDLNAVIGTGIGGRIRKEDVLAAAEAAKAAAKAAAATPVAPAGAPAGDTSGAIEVSDEAKALHGTTVKMSRLRQVIAKRMVDSLQTAAQLTTVFEVDMTRVWNLRAKYKDQFEAVHGTRLTFLPFFVKATTEALAAHPTLNAVINGNEVTYHAQENIGIAVDAPQGLMVPVIKDAGDMSIAGIAEAINTMAANVREGKIDPGDLSGSTFTITNTGSGGALFDTPVLNSPEVGILGVGTIVKRPMVVKDVDGGDSIAIRNMVYLSITYDHRLVDGADASRFLTSVKKRLEAGNFLPDLDLGA